MPHVLSLIAGEANAELGEPDALAADRALEESGASLQGARWLAAGSAWERAFAGDAGKVLALARTAFAGRPVDVNVLPAKGRRKRLLIADMDSTLIHQECIDELAAHIGVGEKVAAITERAMRGEIDFEPALRERVELLKGLREGVVGEVLEERIVLMEGGRRLVQTMRAHGARTLLVSGGFTVFAREIAARLGFDEHRANVLNAAGGVFDGTVAEPILGREAKIEALETTLASLGLDAAEAVAVGDGANDAGMIRIAGLGVAYRAKPILREAADAAIDHADLTALLYLQGYGAEDIVGD